MRQLIPFRLICALLVAGIAHGASGEGSSAPLPGTTALTINEPLDEVMVAGISRFALRALEESPQKRAMRWSRDYSGEAAYDKSMAVNRSRLRTLIGAVDSRVTADGFDVIAKLGGDGVVARSADVMVYAVRWPVLPGVTGEGLLLQPRSTPRARVVALPDADWTPEMSVGLVAGIENHQPVALRLAEHGVQVVVPTLISREDSYSGNPRVASTSTLR